MASITLTTLISGCRIRSEYDENYIPDVDITAMLNASIARAHEIGRQFDTSRFMSSTSIATVAGTNSYALTGALDILDLSLNDVVLKRTNWADRYDTSSNAYSWSYLNYGTETKYEYCYRNDTVYLFPTPDTAETIAVTYTPDITELVADSDTWVAPILWQRFAIYDTLVQCATKAEDDVRPYQAQADRIEALMRNANTDIGQSSTLGMRRRRRGRRY